MSRKATVSRETKETTVKVELDLDGTGNSTITTGLRFFDHLLSQIAQHGLFNLKISATGADQHHVVEDVAIALGKALGQALGERRGIVRMSHSTVPMDDALATVALDLGGRGYARLELPFQSESIGDLRSDMVCHFLESFAIESRLNLHARLLYGVNDHHKAEALFKALAKALDTATRVDERLAGKVPSTKEVIEGT